MTTSAFTRIPIVDLTPIVASPGGAPPQAPAGLVDDVRRVCHEIGFMIVVGHGVDDELVAEVFEMMERFFALSDEQKSRIDKRTSRHFRGWEPVGSEYTNNRPDLREQIDLWTEWPALDPDVEPAYLRLLGPNQWLPDDVVPGMRELWLRWTSALGALADRLLDVLSLGLGLRERHLRDVFGERPMSLTKFIHYPPTPPGGAGVNAHHDAAFLTVLAPGPTPGLQVENRAGEWIDVPSVPRSFVINLGEMLQGMTGNYLVATPHRVVSAGERYSAGYFHGPSLDTRLERLPLAPELLDAVAASPFHAGAGFMARREETVAGVGDMRSDHVPSTYGEQLWNYFARSYPDNMARHHGAAV